MISLRELPFGLLCSCGSREYVRLLIDADEKIQEQALFIVQNLAEDEPGINLVFQELGANVLLSSLTTALESPHEEVVLRVCDLILDRWYTHPTTGGLCYVQSRQWHEPPGCHNLSSTHSEFSPLLYVRCSCASPTPCRYLRPGINTHQSTAATGVPGRGNHLDASSYV